MADKLNLKILSEYLCWLLEADVQSLKFANQLDEWLYALELRLNTNIATNMKIDMIENIVLAIWHLCDCGVEKTWFGNVVEWLSNFTIFQIAPLHLDDELPENIIARMMACRMFLSVLAFRRLFGLPDPMAEPVEEEGAVFGPHRNQFRHQLWPCQPVKPKIAETNAAIRNYRLEKI